RHVLYALAEIIVDELFGGRPAADRLVDWNADPAARAGHHLAGHRARRIRDAISMLFVEIEDLAIKPGPIRKVALHDDVGDVINLAQMRVARVGGHGAEIDIVDRALGAVTIDQIDQATVQPADRRNRQLARANAPLVALLAMRHGARQATL